MTYRLWVSDDRCTMVELWEDGTCRVARRDHPSHTWGPPVRLTEETDLGRDLRPTAGAAMNVVVEVTPATIAKLDLRPDDVVIVKVADNITQQHARLIADTINEAIPDNKVIVVAQNISIEVVGKRL